MSAVKAGTCCRKNCLRPRHLSATGNYSAYCREHQNEQRARRRVKKRREQRKHINPYVRVIARTCERCRRKYPSCFPYFDTAKDEPERLYLVCGLCDGNAALTNTLALFPPPETPLYGDSRIAS